MKILLCLTLILILVPVPATPTPYYGLAMAHPEFTEDLTTLRVEWWYTWGVGDISKPGYVPMLRTGLERDLPATYSGFVLLFNEPNNPEPYGVGLAPAEAVKRYKNARRDYPKAIFVIGGGSVWSTDWTKGFLEECRKQRAILPNLWHFHAYTEEWITPTKAQEFLNQHKLLIQPAGAWITEYGSPAGSLEDFKAMTTWFKTQSWIRRIAPYTNRQMGEPWNIGSGVELIDRDGKLTSIGAYYANGARYTNAR